MITDLLAGLSDQEIQAVADGSTTLELSPNSRIYSPGDLADCLYIVYSGEVEILPEGIPAASDGVFLGPGEFFGEISLIEGHSHTSTAVTTQPTSLLELRWKMLEQIMGSNPILLQNLNSALAGRLRQTDRRLMKALTQFAEEIGRLHARASFALSVSKKAGDLLNWSELWKLILDASLESLKAERGTVYVLDPFNGNLEGMMIRGEGLSKITLQKGQGIAGACALQGEAILVADAQEDSRYFPDYDAISGFVTRAVICTPFRKSDGKIHGIIQLINGTANSFTADDLACLSLFADQLAIGYERSLSVQRIVSDTESNLVTEIISDIKNLLPNSDEDTQKTNLERYFKRCDLAYRSNVETSTKPVRFKTFLEKLVQEICTQNAGINISIGRENLYDGFVTVDPELLLIVLEGLLLEVAKKQDNLIAITGIDHGEVLDIIIGDGSFPNEGTKRQPISFQAAEKFATLHRGSFNTKTSKDGKITLTLQLPLAG